MLLDEFRTIAIEIPDRLREAAEQLNNGGLRIVTVRELISWFGAERLSNLFPRSEDRGPIEARLPSRSLRGLL